MRKREQKQARRQGGNTAGRASEGKRRQIPPAGAVEFWNDWTDLAARAYSPGLGVRGARLELLDPGVQILEHRAGVALEDTPDKQVGQVTTVLRELLYEAAETEVLVVESLHQLS